MTNQEKRTYLLRLRSSANQNLDIANANVIKYQGVVHFINEQIKDLDNEIEREKTERPMTVDEAFSREGISVEVNSTEEQKENVKILKGNVLR